MRRSLASVLVLSLLLAAGSAHAEDLGPDEDTAVALSFGASALSLAALAGGIATDNPTMGWSGFAGVVLLPSLGHWYAGDLDGVGLGLRLGGTAVGFAGLYTFIDAVIEEEHYGGDSGDAWAGLALMAAGTGAIVSGMIYDWATVRGVAHEKNLSFAPLAAPGMAGLSVSGRF